MYKFRFEKMHVLCNGMGNLVQVLGVNCLGSLSQLLLDLFEQRDALIGSRVAMWEIVEVKDGRGQVL